MFMYMQYVLQRTVLFDRPFFSTAFPLFLKPPIVLSGVRLRSSSKLRIQSKMFSYLGGQCVSALAAHY